MGPSRQSCLKPSDLRALGTLPGILLVIPLASMGFTALVALPPAALRRLTWGTAVAAVLTALVVGELIFLGSQGTAFARASRHWRRPPGGGPSGRRPSGRPAGVSWWWHRCLRRPRPTCRRVRGSLRRQPRSDGLGRGSLMLLDQERCPKLLGR